MMDTVQPPNTQPAKTKLRILIVEDGITMRMFYRDVLESAGFEVEEAVNGMEGVERAMTKSFDLMVVDINMPKMDGYQVIRAIREDPELWRVPVIIISTEDKEQDSLKAYEAGANFYLTKPVRPKDLEEMARLLTGTRD